MRKNRRKMRKNASIKVTIFSKCCLVVYVNGSSAEAITFNDI